jgi:hypothetical protein
MGGLHLKLQAFYIFYIAGDHEMVHTNVDGFLVSATPPLAELENSMVVINIHLTINIGVHVL